MTDAEPRKQASNHRDDTQELRATKPWNNALVPALQLIVLGAACVCAYYLTREYPIIPKAIMRLPAVYVSTDDLVLLSRVFLTTTAIQIALLLWRTKTHAFVSPARFANEYLAYLVAWTAAALYVFLATTINYDPQLMAAIGLLSTLGYFALYTAVASWGAALSFPGILFQGVGQTIKRLFSPVGFLVILFFLTPLALGVAFTKSRDIANVVTQVRIALNPVPEGDWGFRSFLPGQVFEQPVQVLQRPGDENSLYILERVGRVLRVDRQGRTAPEVIIDIVPRLGEVESENGALGIAFHPEPASGRDMDAQQARGDVLYLYYTDTRPEDGQTNRLSRFNLDLPTPELRSDSEQPLITLFREGSGFHNGGGLAFGPDGYLYIAVGEGVRTPKNKTSAEALRAGILRIDVSGHSDKSLDIEPFEFGKLEGYRVPGDNPFVGNPNVRNEYWALGLRNPFRIHFDGDDLWVGDVGSTVWEEVNRVERGKHYGFPVIEGRTATGKRGWENLGLPYEEPVYTYTHTAYDRAVIGGIRVQGTTYGPLTDQYVFADNYSSKLFSIPGNQTTVAEAVLLARANQFAQRGTSSVTQLRSGEVLLTTLGAASRPSGEVLELVPAKDARPELPSVLTTAGDEIRVSQADAKTLFVANCARCHGQNGNGMSPDADALGVPMPNFTTASYFTERGRDTIRAIIADGGAANGMSALMPPWSAVLEDAEMEALLDYIESLGTP